MHFRQVLNGLLVLQLMERARIADTRNTNSARCEPAKALCTTNGRCALQCPHQPLWLSPWLPSREAPSPHRPCVDLKRQAHSAF